MTERRHLTQDEIDHVLRWLTPRLFNSPFPRTNADVANGWRNILTDQLKREKFDPQKIDTISEKIRDNFERKMIAPHTPVGKITGTSVGEKSTQFTLKLKSNASSSSSGKSVKVSALFQSLIDAPKNPSTQHVEIRFLEKFTITELYLKRREFQRLYLDDDDFISDINIIPTEDSETDWTDIFSKVYGYGVDDMTSNTCLQITFSVQKLFEYRLSLSEIAKDLEDRNSYIKVIFSPQDVGIIFIYPDKDFKREPNFYRRSLILTEKQEMEVDNGWELDDEDDITDEERSLSRSRISDENQSRSNDEAIDEFIDENDVSEEDLEELFLSTVVEPLIAAGNYGGDTSIGQVYVAWTPYTATIKKTEKMGNGYILEFNDNTLKHNGIKEEEILSWLQDRNWTYRKMNNNYYLENTESSISPMEMLSQAMTDPDQFDGVIKAFIEAAGNFPKLIVLPGVDTDHSYTDSSKIMKIIYGIEVAKRVMTNVFLDILSGDHYVSPVHPALIVSYMTFSGEIIPMTRSAFNYQRIGAFERATFEEQKTAITKSAIYPKLESTHTTATATIFGAVPPLGTGMVEVFESPQYQEIKKRQESEETISKESERRKLFESVINMESEDFELPDIFDADITAPEIPDESIFIPRILRPMEAEPLPDAPTEPVEIKPSDSILTSTVQVEVDSVAEPVKPQIRRLQRGARLK